MIVKFEKLDKENVKVFFSDGTEKIVKNDEIQKLFNENRMCFIVPK